MNLKERLSKLLALTSSPEENEARTAAHLLVKTCRENGVTIRFVLPKQREEKPAPPPVPASSAQRVPFDDLADFLRAVQGVGVGPSSPFGLVSCPKCGFPLMIRGASCPMCARGAPPETKQSALRTPEELRDVFRRYGVTGDPFSDPFGYRGVDAARKRYRGR